MSKQFEHLFTPYQIGNVEIKNRFCMGPMGTAFAYGPYGEFSQEGIMHFEKRAQGGFGLLFSGVMLVDSEVDSFSPLAGNSPLYAPVAFTRTAKELIERIGAHGAKMFPQIGMGLGRNMPGAYAPSEIPVFFAPDQKAPALTKEQIQKKIETMIQAAALMKNCGFPGVEVHAMHWGYLLDQFAMSLMNQRTDEYGGSLENRLRAAREIVEGIKQVCGQDFAVTMRLALKTYIKGFNQADLFGEEEAGRTLEEGIRISQLLESYGYDALSVDTGIYDSFYYAAPPCYMPKGHAVDLAAAAKKAVNIPILAGSRMNDPVMDEAAVKEGKVDAIVLSRASLADPAYPKKLATDKPETIRPCIACNQFCIGNTMLGGDTTCAVNPRVGRELSYGITPALQKKKITVIGGGVAGMEAARVAALRGHEVTIYEKTDQLGGNVIPGGAHEFKKEMHELIAWYEQEMQGLDIPIHYNTSMSAEQIAAEQPDAVLLATGSVPIMPSIPGIENGKVLSTIDALQNHSKIGKKVVIVGGGLVGCEIAYDCAKEGKEVTLVEALPAILSAGEPVPIMNMMMLYDLLSHYNVKVITEHTLTDIAETSVHIQSIKDGDEQELTADTVIVAVGYRPLPSMAASLQEQGIDVYEIGDGKKVGNIGTSIGSAYSVSRFI